MTTFIKYFALFSITFALGIGAAEALKSFNTENTGFTKDEAKTLLYKKVQSLNECNAKFIEAKDTRGATVFMRKSSPKEEGYLVAIDWEYSIRGKHEIILYDKKEFERCNIIIGEAE